MCANTAAPVRPTASPHTEDSERITQGPARSCIIKLQFTEGGFRKRRGEIIHHGHFYCLFLFNSFNS